MRRNKKNSEFEWRVEYDSLPPEDTAPASGPPDEAARRRPGRSLPLIILSLLVTTAIVVLWRMGGSDTPIPEANPLQSSLRAVVEMEIDALQNGDREIYDQIQDTVTRRSNFQPDLENWAALAGTVAGDLVIRDIELLDEDFARADLTAYWDGVPYHLSWYYRRQNERWLHTDGYSRLSDPDERLTSPHVAIDYANADLAAATALIGATEGFITDFCSLLPCADPQPHFRLELAPSMTSYVAEYRSGASATADNASRFRLPSPQRVRWPADDQPEPLVMASLARQMAYDLVVKPNLADQPEENRIALAMATIWIVHHSLDLPSLPATQWLDQAVAEDELQGVLNLIDLMLAGVSPHEAVAASFSPAVYQTVSQSPDYFGWLYLLQEPTILLQMRAGLQEPTAWLRTYVESIDGQVNSWQDPAQLYQNVTPAVLSVHYLNDWVIAELAPDSIVGNTLFFHLIDGRWIPSTPDESLVGEQRVASSEHLTIYFYAWDEAFIPGLLEHLEQAYDEIASNFAMSDPGNFTIVITTSMIVPQSDPPAVDVVISSPNMPYDLTADLEGNIPYLEGTLALTSLMQERHLGSLGINDQRITRIYGFWFWQLEEMGYQTEKWLPLVMGLPQDDWWQFPDTVDSEDWVPLTILWEQPADITAEEAIRQRFVYEPLIARYVIELRGKEAIPDMVGQTMQADSMDDLLQRLAGQTTAEFEPAWRQWVIDRYQSDTP